MRFPLTLLTDECCAPLREGGLSADQATPLADAFRALADPTRLQLLSLISAAPAGEVCACDLAEPLGKSQPTVSHHLKVLREVGLVTSRRSGTWIHYRVVPEQLERLRAVLR